MLIDSRAPSSRNFNMATNESGLNQVVESLNASRCQNERIIIKSEQRDAVIALLNTQDVLAVLPTGFGKSLIFKLFVLTKETLTNHCKLIN